MSLNVKSKIELDTSSSVAHLQNLVANFKTFGAVTEHTKNKIDIAKGYIKEVLESHIRAMNSELGMG